MKAGIVGAGAMGSLFGYFFSRAGIDFVAYEKDPAVVKALSGGLTVRNASMESSGTLFSHSETGTIPFSVYSDPKILNACDIIFILVKSYATREAAIDITPHLKENAIVVSLQNGLGNHTILYTVLENNPLVYGTTTIGGYKDGPASVVIGGMGEIVIGGKDTRSVSRVSSVLSTSGLNISITDSPLDAVWKKAIINASINPLGALMGCVNGAILENPHLLYLQEQILFEAVSIAQKEGISLENCNMAETVRNICRKTSANRCSMLQDMEAGRKTEIDGINGTIIETGLKHGVRAPYNEAVYRLVKAREE